MHFSDQKRTKKANVTGKRIFAKKKRAGLDDDDDDNDDDDDAFTNRERGKQTYRRLERRREK